MLIDHKEKIEQIIEIHQSESKPDEFVSRAFTMNDIESVCATGEDNQEIFNLYVRSKTNLALDCLSKETLDYIQTLYFIGADYIPEETNLSRKQSFNKYLNYVKSFGNDKAGQVYYLSMNNHLSKCMKRGIDMMGWDIDN